MGIEGFPVITYPAALRSQPPTANRFHLTKVGMTGPVILGRARSEVRGQTASERYQSEAV
jgi:hypothetical protein